MFANFIKKSKRLVGIDVEDYKSKLYYSETKVKELENKLMYVEEHLESIIKLINHKRVL